MKKTISNWILALIYMLFIISCSVTLTLNFRPLYYFDIDHLNISELSGLPKEEIKENYDALIDYNVLPGKSELKFPTLAMSEPGRIHFVEVKRIFVAFEAIGVITLVLGIAGTMWKRKRKEFGFLKIAGILTVAVPAVLGIFIAANWDKAFVTFHHIFFNNDYWIFDPAKDPVITILPDTFFLHCAVMILGGVVLGALISVFCYWKSCKPGKLNDPNNTNTASSVQ